MEGANQGKMGDICNTINNKNIYLKESCYILKRPKMVKSNPKLEELGHLPLTLDRAVSMASILPPVLCATLWINIVFPLIIDFFLDNNC